MEQHLSSFGLKKKGSGGKEPGEPVAPDWQKNWVSSIAIKIMAPLLWGLVFIGVAVSFFIYGDVDKKLTRQLNEQADRYVYAIARTFVFDKGNLESLGQTIVSTKYEGVYFNRVRIQIGTLVDRKSVV